MKYFIIDTIPDDLVKYVIPTTTGDQEVARLANLKARNKEEWEEGITRVLMVDQQRELVIVRVLLRHLVGLELNQVRNQVQEEEGE